MDILYIQAFNGPNIFSLLPAIKMQIGLGNSMQVCEDTVDYVYGYVKNSFGVHCDAFYKKISNTLIKEQKKAVNRLPYLVLHLCLELQRQLGYDSTIGNVTDIGNNSYELSYTCCNTQFGKACGYASVNFFNELLDGSRISLEKELEKLQRIKADNCPSLLTQALTAEADRRGIPVDEISNSGVLRLGYGKNQKYVSSTLLCNASSISVTIAQNNLYSRRLLDEQSIPVPESKLCFCLDEAILFVEEAGYPVSLTSMEGMPEALSCSNISNIDDLRASFTKIKSISTGVIIEKTIYGKSYQLVIVNNKMVAVFQKSPTTEGYTYSIYEGEISSISMELVFSALNIIGLHTAAVDIVIPDITIPMNKDYGAIVSITPHLDFLKYEEVKSKVLSTFFDTVFPHGVSSTIPIISITGTNGKTTTTRMIGKILQHHGYITGMTTTHGIYVNGKCVEEGDRTGPKSARKVLNNNEVEAAVLETARGGILREGLAFKAIDAAVFTNLTDDHLGEGGINSLEDMLHLKSLVLKCVKSSGTSILNADDPMVMKIYGEARGNVLLFSLDAHNSFITHHRNLGGDVLYTENDSIFLSEKGIIREVIGINDIPATINGALKHNIYNSLAAIGAAHSIGIPTDTIRDALMGFSCSPLVNHGRFNSYILGGVKVVLDFGHNIDGYRFTLESLRNMKPERLIGIVGIPGNRRDIDMFRIGKLCAKHLDIVFIREDINLRGRLPYEAGGIIRAGAIEGGLSSRNVEIIPDEKAGLKKALSIARDGEIIVVFYDKIHPLVDILEKYTSDHT